MKTIGQARCGSWRSSVGSAGLALVAVGCLGACSPLDGYDQEGGPAIASQITSARSPIVVSVSYEPGDAVDPASIRIVVRESASVESIGDLMCGVVAPALLEGAPPVSFSVLVFDESSREVADDEYPCPAPSLH